MAETRTYNPDGSLRRLIVDNSDKNLNLQLEDIVRSIPNDAAKVTYTEFDDQDVVTYTVTKTRQQLLNLTDTFSYLYDYRYYDSGAVDTIRTRVFDAFDQLLSDQTLKHYEDGRQPEYI